MPPRNASLCERVLSPGLTSDVTKESHEVLLLTVAQLGASGSEPSVPLSVAALACVSRCGVIELNATPSTGEALPPSFTTKLVSASCT